MRRRRTSPPPFSLFAFQDIVTCVTAIMILVTMLLALDMVNQTEGAPRKKTAHVSDELGDKLTATSAEIERLKDDLQRRQQAVSDVAGLDFEQLKRQLRELQAVNQNLGGQLADAEREQKSASKRLDQARGELERRRRRDSQTAEQLREQLRQVEEQMQKLKKSKRLIFNRAEGTAKSPWLVEVSEQKIVVAEIGREQPPREFSNAESFDRWAATRSPAADYFVLLVKPTGVELSYAVERKIKDRGFDLGVDLLAPGQTAIDPKTGATSK